MGSINEVCDFLKKSGTYFLATCEGDNPRVRPFGTAHIFEGKLYIQTGLKKDVAKQLAKNSKAEICAVIEGTWLRVAATLVLDDRRDARISMLEAYPELQSMYNADDGNTAVYYLQDAVATFYSFTESPRTVKF